MGFVAIHILFVYLYCMTVSPRPVVNASLLTWLTIFIDYYMAFFISHVISTRDAHIRPRVESPRANMGRGLIWHVIWKMPYHNLLIVYFNASVFIFVRADRFQKPCSWFGIWCNNVILYLRFYYMYLET